MRISVRRVLSADFLERRGTVLFMLVAQAALLELAAGMGLAYIACGVPELCR